MNYRLTDILGLEHPRVVIATGARWTRCLYSTLELPLGELDGAECLHARTTSPRARSPQGPIVVFDFDNYYMGSLLAEHLARSGDSVTYVTPAGHASAWAFMTNEQPQVHRALAQCGRAAADAVARYRASQGGEATRRRISSPARNSICRAARWSSSARVRHATRSTMTLSARRR